MFCDAVAVWLEYVREAVCHGFVPVSPGLVAADEQDDEFGGVAREEAVDVAHCLFYAFAACDGVSEAHVAFEAYVEGSYAVGKLFCDGEVLCVGCAGDGRFGQRCRTGVVCAGYG